MLQIKVNGISLHSKYHPLKEAEKFLIQNILNNNGLIIVLGAGYGYLFTALKQTHPKSKIISIPYNKELGIESLKHNYTNRKQWDEKSNLVTFLENNITEENIKDLQVIEWKPTSKAFPTEAKNINTTLVKRIRRINGNLLTTARFGKKWIKNSLKNYIITDNYINKIEIDKPIIIVSSGKSLEKSFELIKDIRSKVTLISLSSANMALKYHNITPDITFSTDPGYYSKLHLYGYKGIIAMPLSNSTSNKNPVLLLNQGNYYENQIIDQGKIPAIRLSENGTVAGTALQFALNRNNKNIYLIGQDLQTTDIESHVSPYAFDDLLKYKETKTSPYYSIKYIRWYNQGVTFKTYRDWFSQIAQENPNRIYRINSNTPKIQGIEDINGEIFLEQIRSYISTKNIKIDYYTNKLNKKDQVITLLNKWLKDIEQEENIKNPLFYLISTSHYTDNNKKALSECKYESLKFLKELLLFYGKQLL